MSWLSANKFNRLQTLNGWLQSIKQPIKWHHGDSYLFSPTNFHYKFAWFMSQHGFFCSAPRHRAHLKEETSVRVAWSSFQFQRFPGLPGHMAGTCEEALKNPKARICMEFRKMVTMTLYAGQQKRHRCIEQSFGLCGRGRGWDDLGEWHWNMYIIIHEMNCQSRFNAWDRVLGTGELEWPRGMGWGERWEGGSRWGTHVHPWQIHVNVRQNHYNIVK